MKRTRIQLYDIAAYDNLLLATWKAARGKRARPDVAHFTAHLDSRLRQLAEDILQDKVPYGRYRQFYIHDPKLRLIHAACFADRVLHHAIMNHAEPVFERTLVPTTYACRPDKGVHKAVAQVQKNLQRFPWFVKVDIDGYFPSIDHARLFELLERRFKGRDFLALLWRIMDSYHARQGKGLPIGSLTSQHFANYYLDGADRFLLEHPRVCAQVRYMDDIIWWCVNKASAKEVLGELQAYLNAERLLQLKPDRRINRSQGGVTYCGYRVLPGTIRLPPRKQRRYRQLREQWEAAWQAGDINSRKLQEAYAAVYAITLHADSTAWRRRSLQLHPSVYDSV
jgi:RNA-directed DNA polymerase